MKANIMKANIMKTNTILSITFCVVAIITACSTTSSKNNIPTIPAPPQNLSADQGNATLVVDSPPAAVAQTAESSTKQNASGDVGSTATDRIQEERGVGGTVNQIKVENKGDIPTYYINPPLQQDLNLNSAPNKSVATPSWQINW